MQCEDESKEPSYVPRNPRSSILYQIVESHWGSYQHHIEEKTGRPLPKYIISEFDEYLKCGILEHGFMRVVCSKPSCGLEHLVGFSCKGRGFCESCGGRRMVDEAEYLIDLFLPEISYRQWVLSLPIPLRFWMAVNRDLFSKVHKIHREELSRFYTDRSPERRSGGITFVQRFGSDLRLNIHYHTLMMDGFYQKNSKDQWVFQSRDVTGEDVKRVLIRTSSRIIKLLRRKGYLSQEGEPTDCPVLDDNFKEQFEHLADLEKTLYCSKTRVGLDPNLSILTKIGSGFGYDEELPVTKSPLCEALNGFSLHAATHINTLDRDRLFQMIEYQARPPVSPKRLEVLKDGRIKLRLKTPYSDGTTHVLMEPFEFLSRLKALIPPPGQHQIIYFGVFSPNCEDREDFRLISGSKKCEFYKAPKPLSDKPEKDPKLDTTNALKHSAWARHLKRTFKVDVSRCSACGSDMKIMAIIHNKAEIDRYLDHVKGYQRGPPPEVGDDVSIKVEAISELMTAD